MRITGLKVTSDELQAYIDRAYDMDPHGDYTNPIHIMRMPIMTVNDNGAFGGSNIINAKSYPVPTEVLDKLYDMTDLIKWVVKEYCQEDRENRYHSDGDEGDPSFLYLYQIFDSPNICPATRYVRFAVFKPKLS